jgi:hypothetical protein
LLQKSAGLQSNLADTMRGRVASVHGMVNAQLRGSPASSTDVAEVILMVVPSKNPPASLPCYSELPDTSVRRRDARFVSQTDLDSWQRDRRATVDGPVLTLASGGQRYVLHDAARILGPRGPSADLFGMTGRIVAVSELLSLGASLSACSARIGNAEYDLQLGFLVYKIEA